MNSDSSSQTPPSQSPEPRYCELSVDLTVEGKPLRFARGNHYV